jgi:predicted transport protein
MALLSQNKDKNVYCSTWQHNKPLSDELMSCSMEEFELILALSSEALKTLRQSTCSIQFQEILNTKILELNSQKQNEFEKLQFEFERKKNSEQIVLQRKVQELQTNLEQSIQSYQALNQNFMNLQGSTQTNFEKYLHSSLESQKKSIEQNHTKVESIYKQQISSLQESLNEYTKKAMSNNVSSNKGKSGEQSFDSLVETFTTWKIEDTSKTPQSCDRFGEIRGCKTLFEIKNYSYNIPRKEVDKFKRDLEVHTDCPLGIFISLNTMIIGAPQEFFYTEFTSSNQLLIYVQQFNSYDNETLFSVLNSLVEIALLLHKKSSILEEDSGLQRKVDSLKPILQNEILMISKIITEVQGNTKFLVETIQKQNSSLKHNLEKIQFTFKTVFQTLFEDSVCVESSHDEMKPPRKRRQVKKKEPIDNAIVINVT